MDTHIFEAINLYSYQGKIPARLLEDFFHLPLTPERLQLLEHLLKEEKIEAVDVLLNYALRLQDDWDLYAVSITLRNNVDLNVYVNSGTGKYLHLLAIVVQNHKLSDVKKGSLLWKLLVLLKLKGLSLDYPLVSISNLPETKTLKDYFHEDLAFYNALPSIVTDLQPEEEFFFRALLNIQEGLTTIEITEPQYKFLVESRTYNHMKKRLSFRKIISIVELDSIMPVLALQHSNEHALLHYVKTIALVSYPLTNLLCLRCQGNGLIQKVWKATLIGCVKHGLQLDLFQYNLLKQNNSEFLTDLKEAYKTPYWKKFFRRRKERAALPDRLRRLLDLVCGSCAQTNRLKEMFEELSSFDKQKLEAMLLTWQKRKLSLECSCLQEPRESVSEFVVYGSHKTPLLLIKYYRVFFKNEGLLYIICSDQYKNVNKIPEFQALEEFARIPLLQKIERNLASIQNHGGNPSKPETSLSFILTELNEDKITNNTTNTYTSRFLMLEDRNDYYHGIYSLDNLSEAHIQATIAYIHQR